MPANKGKRVMTNATKKKAPKKTPVKNKSASRPSPKKVIPEPDNKPLPRGQERLADGTIRLSAKMHALPGEPQEYSVHGLRMMLSGDVLIGGKDANWLPLTNCAACKEERTAPVTIKRIDDHLVFMYRCENEECKLHLTYVRVHSPKTVVID